MFDAERLVVVYRDEEGDDLYEVDLEKMTSSSKMLDWIFQVREKGWASPKDVGDFVQALDDLFRPQANLCSGGADKHLDATKFLRKHVRTGKAACRAS